MPKTIVFWCCILAFALHLLIAVKTDDPYWISRSGASIVAVGLLLQTWKILTTRRADDMPFWNTQSGHADLRASIFILISGTLLQGYGDLIFSAIKKWASTG